MLRKNALTLLLLVIIAATPAYAEESSPELPRKRHIYTLGEVAPLEMVLARAELEGKTCEMCDFTNYETDFSVETNSEGVVTAISWLIVNDFESGPIISEWKSLNNRYAELISVQEDKSVTFKDSRTVMTIENAGKQKGRFLLKARISHIK
jgi:hypothetical protein